jgi:hypothetical protein
MMQQTSAILARQCRALGAIAGASITVAMILGADVSSARALQAAPPDTSGSAAGLPAQPGVVPPIRRVAPRTPPLPAAVAHGLEPTKRGKGGQPDPASAGRTKSAAVPDQKSGSGATRCAAGLRHDAAKRTCAMPTAKASSERSKRQ